MRAAGGSCAPASRRQPRSQPGNRRPQRPSPAAPAAAPQRPHEPRPPRGVHETRAGQRPGAARTRSASWGRFLLDRSRAGGGWACVRARAAGEHPPHDLADAGELRRTQRDRLDGASARQRRRAMRRAAGGRGGTTLGGGGGGKTGKLQKKHVCPQRGDLRTQRTRLLGVLHLLRSREGGATRAGRKRQRARRRRSAPAATASLPGPRGACGERARCVCAGGCGTAASCCCCCARVGGRTAPRVRRECPPRLRSEAVEVNVLNHGHVGVEFVLRERGRQRTRLSGHWVGSRGPSPARPDGRRRDRTTAAGALTRVLAAGGRRRAQPPRG